MGVALGGNCCTSKWPFRFLLAMVPLLVLCLFLLADPLVLLALVLTYFETTLDKRNGTGFGVTVQP